MVDSTSRNFCDLPHRNTVEGDVRSNVVTITTCDAKRKMMRLVSLLLYISFALSLFLFSCLIYLIFLSRLR
jgi:hypothetical protein